MRERLKEFRKARHITQAQLAEALHVSKSAVESYEYGRADMTDRVIYDICRIYNINETWLRTGDGDMDAPMDREQEIAKITAQMFKAEDDDFRYQLQKVIADLTEEQIATLKDIALKMLEEIK